MKKEIIKILKTTAICSFLLLLTVFIPVQAADGTSDVSGYAWSDTIGWIDFNPNFGGVKIDNSTGFFSGYAWSDNIGWISFSESLGCLTPPCKARMDVNTGQVSNWAKAITADGQGWGGWINMRGSNPDYGVDVDLETGDFSGYAWGSDVVGWISFSGNGYKVTTGKILTPPGPDFTLNSSNNISVVLLEGQTGKVDSSITTITVNADPGFTEDISLSSDISTVIPGAKDNFSDSTLSSSEYSSGSTFYATVPAETAPGLYHFTIIGDGETITGRTIEITLNISSFSSPDWEEF